MRRRRGLLIAVGTLWLCAAAVGLGVLFNYEATPGVAADAPKRWPASSKIDPDGKRATLLLMAHPQCPCTRASIGELAVIMARLQGKLSAYVLFLKPKGLSEEWDQTDLWRNAAAIPGVTVMEDEGGAEGALFGATVSGQTLLYDRTGRLVFSGGITASRGHSGDNVGRTAVIALVNGGRAERTETPVFGCALHNPSEKELQEEPSWKKSEK